MIDQVKLIKAAKAKGLNPSRGLTPAQHRSLVLDQMTLKEKALAAATALSSAALTSLGLRTVPLEIAQSNKAICEQNTCGRFSKLKGDIPVCNGCGCSGKFLESKWLDVKQKCPQPVPLWDNTTWASKPSQ